MTLNAMCWLPWVLAQKEDVGGETGDPQTQCEVQFTVTCYVGLALKNVA